MQKRLHGMMSKAAKQKIKIQVGHAHASCTHIAGKHANSNYVLLLLHAETETQASSHNAEKPEAVQSLLAPKKQADGIAIIISLSI